MKTLLIVDASPNDQGSNTRGLTAAYADKWQSANPQGRVIRRDVSGDAVQPLSQATIGAFYTPEDQRSPEQRRLVAQSDSLVDELFAADEIVLGSPMHNFSVSGGMKAWIDQICRVGRTFNYTEQGPKGALGGRRAVIVASSGGDYSEGTPLADLNHNDTYLQTVLGFIGISDVQVVSAAGVAINDQSVEQARERLLALA
ncbi:FMN-dependent NADH-azoreductase [Ferrimonas sediminicola]|uniref:FMN dependent NADH:quinone oxidoreductase n=1 Tax=Ferrimonas sediminicola TaxID=2569538 RepID=A0A4U1BIH1_9GAMM|nr:NAD(P)H-dependent oxidoreductase [Ferrimonas sediminicola]TKB50576.1 FMN-dependent NADH-azoreductase [Ferrimonas sediminicola]